MNLELRYSLPIFVSVGRPYSDDDKIVEYFFGLQTVLNEFCFAFRDFESARNLSNLRPGETIGPFILQLIYCMNNFGYFLERLPKVLPPMFEGASDQSKRIFGSDFFEKAKEARNSIMHMEDYLFPIKSQKPGTRNSTKLGTLASNGGVVNVVTACDEKNIYVRERTGKLLEIEYTNLFRNVAWAILVLKSNLETNGFHIDLRGIEIVNTQKP